MRTVRKIVTSDEQGAVHLEVPVGLRGKVLEMLVVWQEVSSNERWPEGWFERTSGAVADPTFVRHDVQLVEERDSFE
jgi:hypothetical protein